jgi:hypothetical protein
LRLFDGQRNETPTKREREDDCERADRGRQIPQPIARKKIGAGPV